MFSFIIKENTKGLDHAYIFCKAIKVYEENTREAGRNAALLILFYVTFLSCSPHFVACFITDKMMVKPFLFGN